MKFKIKFADQIVGALSIIAIAALVFFTFFIASTQKWFVKKHYFFTKISSANSVNEGMALQYKGFAIGKVKKISLGDDDNVIVHFYVLDEYIDRDCWVMNYPYGNYSREVIDYISSRGACLGLTTEVRVASLDMDDRFTLPRFDCNDFPPKSENYKKE